MKEWIKMFILSETSNYYTLVSEGISPTEVREFADIFRHNYVGKVTVCDEPKSDPSDCIAIVNKVPAHLIRGNYNRKEGCFLVATHKYDSRGGTR